MNYYAYCYGNPITYTDPSGHIPVLVVVAVKVGARIIFKHVVKKAAKKYTKKAVKKTVKKYAKKAVKKAAKKIYKKAKKSKITKKKNNKVAKKSRAKSSKKKTNKKKHVSKAKKKAQKEVQKRSSGGCFVAGTMISTEDGFTPIEEIKVGDRVWSEDTAACEKALKKVKKVFVREKDSIIRLSINGEVINTTEEHPFWVKDQGWIPAGSLHAGDIVKLQSGEYAPIEEYQVVILDEPIPVYNFHVEDFGCYYVSEQNVLVHNKCKKIASDILAKEIRGSVHSRFPKEWLDSNFEEIERAAKQGDSSAKRARKLLTDKRFKKGDNRKKGGNGKRC